MAGGSRRMLMGENVPIEEIKAKAFSIYCPFCRIGTISFYELPVTGRPSMWPKDALCVAECNRCHRKEFLVKLPEHLVKVIMDALEKDLSLSADAVSRVRKALGLY